MNSNAAAPRENHHSVRKALRPAALLVCQAALLVGLAGAACGQRGPLYLPAQEPPASTAPAAAASPDTAPDEAVDPEDEDAKEDNADETGRN